MKSKGTLLATGKPTSTTEGEGNVISTKSVMQRVLMSDPTLRTLFWLEEEENRKKKKTASTLKPGKCRRIISSHFLCLVNIVTFCF